MHQLGGVARHIRDVICVLIDTTVQEKNITYPTDAKLAIKIINRLNKLAKHHNIAQRRTYVKEVKKLSS
jgi:IS5 family transposase